MIAEFDPLPNDPNDPQVTYTITYASSTSDYGAREKLYFKEMMHQKTFHRYRHDPIFMAQVAKRRVKAKAAKKARKKNRKL